MGIRIQPPEIDVPEDNPFKNDLLGRKEPVEVLTHIVGSLEGPCVLAVDAAWGAGKTTFLRIWAQHLRNQEFPVVEFNAWETDFSGDPFVALSTELTEGLQKYAANELLATKIGETKRVAREVLRRAVPGVIRLATAGLLDVGPLMEKEVGQAFASYVKDRLSEYREAQESVKAFRVVLQDMADTLSKSGKDRPLIVVIDELDRCRPSYATELLEIAKHLFAVDHMVFVLAVNRAELTHSIRALYGGGFDAEGYLRRFFDLDFRLPDPERDAFINAMLDAIGLNDYVRRTKDREVQRDVQSVRKLLLRFFHAPDLSLRRIAQAIHRIGLVFALLRSDQRAFAVTAVVALIVRTVDSDLYHRFVRGEVSDLEVVNRMFERPDAKTLPDGNERILFEATMIVAACRMSDVPLESSPLFQRYSKLVNAGQTDNTTTDLEQTHALKVIDLVQHLLAKRLSEGRGIEFWQSVRRIELLSSGLIDESPK